MESATESLLLQTLTEIRDDLREVRHQQREHEARHDREALGERLARAEAELERRPTRAELIKMAVSIGAGGAGTASVVTTIAHRLLGG